ncbi:MAG: hypothetical protein ACOY3Y_13715 [Acidobacteriota bacterium]
MRYVTWAAVAILLATAVAGEDLFLPMVAQKQGQDGAWWNTEVWISNPGETAGGYAAVFLPAGQDNENALREEPQLEEVPPGATVHRDDLVPQGSVGAVRVVVTPGLLVYGRVFNAAGRGSFGQGMPAWSRSDALQAGQPANLIGLRRSAQFRANLALLNPTLDPCSVRLRLLGPRGEALGEEVYQLPPGGQVQVNDVLHGLGVSRGEHIRAEVVGDQPFFALASVIDSRSGAPTLVVPQR